MRYWVETPIEQWVRVREEPLHSHPWAIVIGDFVRARYTTEAEALACQQRVKRALLEDGVATP